MNYDLMITLTAITKTMPCNRCPYPCKLKENASQASCDMHWKEILTNLTESEVNYGKDNII